MSVSTRSGASGNASGRQTLPDKKPDRTGGPPSPDSPIRSEGPLTRKRAASLRTERPRIDDLSLTAPAVDRSPPLPPPHLPESGRDLICLCTPAPKVPRPRNGMSPSLHLLPSHRCLPPNLSSPFFISLLQTQLSELCFMVTEVATFFVPAVSHRTFLRNVSEGDGERQH